VTQADLVALQRRRDVVETRILPLLGLQGVPIGQKFCCLLHKEAHPSAAIIAPREGQPDDMYVYGDFHGTGRKTWPLAVVYWAYKTGKPPEELSKSSLVTWTLRMLIDAGVLAPSSAPRPQPLPPDVPAYARKVYEGFCFLLQCKWWIKGERPQPCQNLL
jgi:hypothetical protein